MKRVIKFRFYDTIDKMWMVDGRTQTDILDFAFLPNMNWTHISREDAPQRVVVAQFTGLVDKNGREIYEGDILTWRECDLKEYEEQFDYEKYLDTPRYSEIKWNSEGARFYLTAQSRFRVISSDMHVCGNISENPELLQI